MNPTDGNFYFGCISKTVKGHYLYNRHFKIMADSHLPLDFPCDPKWFDGYLLPFKRNKIQGAATIVHLNGWTIVTFVDYSADSRPGSNSAFILRGTLDLSKALERSQAVFPSIFARFNFDIRDQKEIYGPLNIK